MILLETTRDKLVNALFSTFILEARIITVADIVEAISNHRPYRAALGVDVAMEIITQERGSKLDADVVDACVALFKHGDFCFE